MANCGRTGHGRHGDEDFRPVSVTGPSPGSGFPWSGPGTELRERAMVFLLEDLFDIKDIDQDGKKFDNGNGFKLSTTNFDVSECSYYCFPQYPGSKLRVKPTIFT